ncbi:hypothetical protein GTY74_19195 [Streptomyces sp. SID8350]|nr:hypothetical protein [Streptomyces sp. SID8350]
MPKPDALLVDVAALVESGRSNQMALTVVAGGAVITGRLAPEAVWRQRVSEVLADSARLRPCPTWSVGRCAGHGEWTVGMDCSGRTVGDSGAVAAAGSGAPARGRGREHR